MATVLSAVINRPEAVRLGVVAGNSEVLIGQYLTGRIDIGDIAGLGQGPALSAGSALAHEVIEQTAKQVFHLPDLQIGYDVVHELGRAAQGFVSGFDPGVQEIRSVNNAKTITTPHTKGNQRITVTTHWVNGNLVRVTRESLVSG